MATRPNFPAIPVPAAVAPWQGEQLIVNRSRPRYISLGVISNGIPVPHWLPIFPVSK